MFGALRKLLGLELKPEPSRPAAPQGQQSLKVEPLHQNEFSAGAPQATINPTSFGPRGFGMNVSPVDEDQLYGTHQLQNQPLQPYDTPDYQMGGRFGVLQGGQTDPTQSLRELLRRRY